MATDVLARSTTNTTGHGRPLREEAVQDSDIGDRSISYTIPGKQVAQLMPKRASGPLQPACPHLFLFF